MGVHAVRPEVAVTGEVELNDAIRGDLSEVSVRIPAVIKAAHCDVIEVDEEPTIRLLGEAREEDRLSHGGGAKGDVA
jgi:hypothetical protein